MRSTPYQKMDEGICILIFAAPINRRKLRLKRIGSASSQRHNLRLLGAVNQRACLRTPSYRDSDSPDSSRCLARALASNAKQDIQRGRVGPLARQAARHQASQETLSAPAQPRSATARLVRVGSAHAPLFIQRSNRKARWPMRAPS